MPQSEVTQVESLLDEQPGTLPALDIVVDDFELRGKRLGRVEMEAQNRGGEGAQRDEHKAPPGTLLGLGRRLRHSNMDAGSRSAASGIYVLFGRFYIYRDAAFYYCLFGYQSRRSRRDHS